MLLFRDLIHSNPSLLSSSSTQNFHDQFYNKSTSTFSSLPVSPSLAPPSYSMNNSCGGGSLSVKMNTFPTCGTNFAEKGDDGDGFFSRESSDSGLLEEIVNKFLPRTKPSKCETTFANPQEESLLLPPLVSESTLVSTAQECYDDVTKKGFLKNDSLGVFSSDHQGFPMQQFDAFNGFSSVQAMALGNEQIMMNHAENCVVEDVFQYHELLNAFAIRMQNT